MTDSIAAFPLTWPANRPRTRAPAYSAQSERRFHVIVNAVWDVGGEAADIGSGVHDGVSITDGFQLSHARMYSRRGMSASLASLPAEPGVE